MYGSIFKMKTLPGKRDEVLKVFREWEEERNPDASVDGGYMLISEAEDDVMIGIAIAKDEASYRANNDTPGQAEWYAKWRALLVADPEWNDGEIISMI